MCREVRVRWDATQADQVVRRKGQVTQPRTLYSANSGSLRRSKMFLIQPKALLDALANLQAHGVALTTGGAVVDGAAPIPWCGGQSGV